MSHVKERRRLMRVKLKVRGEMWAFFSSYGLKIKVRKDIFIAVIDLKKVFGGVDQSNIWSTITCSGINKKVL